jgi:hypothetical protein
MSQFWLTSPACTTEFTAIELFTELGCNDNHDSWYWDMIYMNQASAESFVKKGDAWCAGPGNAALGGRPRVVRSFRLLKG